MDIDISRHLGAVDRTVSQREYEGQLARVVTATRTYETDIEDVWDALTNAERIPRWFLPISGDLRLGGHYQLEGNAGGEITRCDRPEHLSLTWVMGGGPPSWVNVALVQVSTDATRLELEHVAHVPEEFWDRFGPGAVGVGWDLALLGLGQHLATGAAIAPKEAAAWAASEQGKACIRASSEAWRRAAVAAGTDEADAAQAADQTTAFYLGS